ncbi:unnamed protein product [Caenorhabditis nigoni]|uniref:Nuclear receptor domain-containing protein n=1 Tax=Caenorhabditis nigoni TaxID=1611254 RepID=A0A2G5UFU6_9PELO|nr:hypothetical protein B9Z55_010289 [Caenorhabditis nigoni]
MRACQVCEKVEANVATGYGITLCNGCKMVYRRHTLIKEERQEPIVCNHSKRCHRCTLIKCLEFGLKMFRESKEVQLLKALNARNAVRSSNFINSQPREDLNLKEIMRRGPIKFETKTVNIQDLNSHQWANLQMVTTIEFMKTFDVMKHLTETEVTGFIKKTYFNTAIFFMAMNSYFSGQSAMMFPGNKDVFPEETAPIHEIGSSYWGLFNSIRCELIAKFIELQVSQDELLLLAVVISCGSIITEKPIVIEDANGEIIINHPPISTLGSQFIQSYRDFHLTALFDNCMKNENAHGHIRYNNLLSIIQLVTQTMQKLDMTYHLFQLYQRDGNLSKLVREFF